MQEHRVQRRMLVFMSCHSLSCFLEAESLVKSGTRLAEVTGMHRAMPNILRAFSKVRSSGLCSKCSCILSPVSWLTFFASVKWYVLKCFKRNKTLYKNVVSFEIFWCVKGDKRHHHDFSSCPLAVHCMCRDNMDTSGRKMSPLTFLF